MRRTAVAFAALLLAAGVGPALAGGGTPKLANVDAGPHLAELFNDSPTLVTGTNGVTVMIRGLTADHDVSLVLEGPSGLRLPVPLTRVIVLGDLEGEDHGHAEEGDTHTATPSDGHGIAPSAATAPMVGDPHGGSSADSHGAADPHGPSTSTQASVRNGHGAPSASNPVRPAPIPDAHGAGRQVDAHSTSSSRHDDGAVVADHPVAGSVDHAAVEAHGQATATATETYLARGSVSLPTTGTWTAHLVIRDSHGDTVAGEVPLAVFEGGPSTLYLGFTGSLIFGSMLFGLVLRRQKGRAPITREGRD